MPGKAVASHEAAREHALPVTVDLPALDGALQDLDRLLRERDRMHPPRLHAGGRDLPPSRLGPVEVVQLGAHEPGDLARPLPDEEEEAQGVSDVPCSAQAAKRVPEHAQLGIGENPILRRFLGPLLEAGDRVHLKVLILDGPIEEGHEHRLAAVRADGRRLLDPIEEEDRVTPGDACGRPLAPGSARPLQITLVVLPGCLVGLGVLVEVALGEGIEGEDALGRGLPGLELVLRVAAICDGDPVARGPLPCIGEGEIGEAPQRDPLVSLA